MRTVKFDGKDSWADFGLIRSAATIEAPDPKTSTVDIDGSDGVLDLTDYFGETLYKNRKIDITLSALPQEPLENVFVNTDGVIQPEIELKDNGKGGLTVYGKTRQNLWIPKTSSQNGVTVTLNADGSITLSGTATNDAYIVMKGRGTYFNIIPTRTYTLSVDKTLTGCKGVWAYVCDSNNNYIQNNYVGGTNYASLTKTFVAPDGAYSWYMGVGINKGSTVSGTYRVMLNEGAEAEPWCPPGLNSVESLEIVTAGKNLAAIDIDTTSAGVTIGSEDDGAISFVGTATSQYSQTSSQIYLPTNTDMVASSTVAGSVGEGGKCYFIVNGILGSETTTIVSTRNGAEVAFNTGEFDIYRLLVVVEGNGVTFDCKLYPQLERGTTATPYEPPAIATTPIDLQGNALCSLPDGTRDELRVDEAGAVTLVQRCGVDTLSSDDSDWTWDSAMLRGETALSNEVVGNTNAEYDVLCDVLANRAAGALGSTGSYIIVGTLAGGTAYAIVNGAETENDLLGIIGGGTLIYKLATEQEIDLGYIPMEQFDRSFHALFSRLQNAIHGKRCRIELSEDPGFYYLGRVTVDKWKTNEAVGEIAVSCDCDPYKLRQGVTRRIVNGTGTAQTVTFNNLRKKVVPVFNTNGTAWTIKQGTNSFTANGSSWSDGKLYFSQGANELTITGTGRLEVTYQERGL